MRDHDISQRRACRLVGVDPKTVRRDRPPDNPPPDNPEIRREMKAVAPGAPAQPETEDYENQTRKLSL